MKYIGKSYLQMTKEEKDYFIKLYYENKNLKVKEIGSKLGLSTRCTNSIFKEYNINSRLKNRYTLNENYFSKIDTSNKAYILGLIYADGFIGDSNSNNLSITQKDKEVLDFVKEEMNYTGQIRKGNKGGFENSQDLYVINFSNKKICDDLRKLGVYTNKSLTISKIPDIDKNLKKHFLRGYFDGDGSITLYTKKTTKNKKTYFYEKGKMSIIATDKMIEDFIRTFNITKYSVSKSKTYELKYIHINAKSELEYMYNLMYDEALFYNKRKKIIWDKIISAII